MHVRVAAHTASQGFTLGYDVAPFQGAGGDVRRFASFAPSLPELSPIPLRQAQCFAPSQSPHLAATLPFAVFAAFCSTPLARQEGSPSFEFEHQGRDLCYLLFKPTTEGASGYSGGFCIGREAPHTLKSRLSCSFKGIRLRVAVKGGDEVCFAGLLHLLGHLTATLTRIRLTARLNRPSVCIYVNVGQ
jgi:hypothetical protein